MQIKAFVKGLSQWTYRLFEFGNSAVTSAVAVIVGFTLSLALSPALSEFDSFDSLLLECSSFVQVRILIRPRAVACEIIRIETMSAELVLQLSFNLSAHFLYKIRPKL